LKGRVAVDGGPPVEVSMLTQSTQRARRRVYSMNMPTAQFDMVRRASELSVQTEGLDERFSLGQMTQLLKIVDDCVADLRRVYNVSDPATGEASPLPRRAKSNLAYLISNDGYPRDALEREQDGTVKFVLLIDETGRVADCMVAGTSGAAARDAQSCAILDTGAKFEPAIGPDGKPAKDAVTARIVWSTVP
jgi:outer membrane biosynthesis protein TonB